MMKVLIVGNGGREHALAWKVAQSPQVTQLYVAPGNAGTDTLQIADCRQRSGALALQIKNVSIKAEDTTAFSAFARHQHIDLVIVGPEAPLAAGLSDALRAAGVRVFGPSQAAAQIEASKVFAKDFMARRHIPTARYATFTDFYDAIGYLLSATHPVVIKASGLAAGKGVIVPDCADEAEKALRDIMLNRVFGAAGDEVVIEERLEGDEVSLMCFTDGVTVKPMIPAQDHKRLRDNDEGPNTGGMGAFAPTPLCPPSLVAELARTFLQPTVDGLRAEGKPFVGVLYAGLMLTKEGPRVLEFNARFGDPETQVVLPLLETDLLEVMKACVDGRLAEVEVRWKEGAAVCVVLASEGYPDNPIVGRAIEGLEVCVDDTIVFHAGTKREGERVVTAGGRVVGVVGMDFFDNGDGTDKRRETDELDNGDGMDKRRETDELDNGDRTDKRRETEGLARATEKAYARVEQIKFEGRQYRKDIAKRIKIHQ
jgi:phosphoribosylamine--glycine ligase